MRLKLNDKEEQCKLLSWCEYDLNVLQGSMCEKLDPQRGGTGGTSKK